MRIAVDSINPDIRMAFCACMSSWDLDGVDAYTITKILAGNTKPLIRLSGAPYWAVNQAFGQRLQGVIEQERMARKILGRNKIELEDKVYRAYGILTNCRKISSEECKELLSDIKLGTDMGIIKELDDLKVNKLILYTKPANLQKYVGKPMEDEERDITRATVIKQIIEM